MFFVNSLNSIVLEVFHIRYGLSHLFPRLWLDSGVGRGEYRGTKSKKSLEKSLLINQT